MRSLFLRADTANNKEGQNDCELGARICQWSAEQSVLAVRPVRLGAAGHPIVAERAPAASAASATRLRQAAAASVHPAADPARCPSTAVRVSELAATGFHQPHQYTRRRPAVRTRRRPAVPDVRHGVRALVLDAA